MSAVTRSSARLPALNANGKWHHVRVVRGGRYQVYMNRVLKIDSIDEHNERALMVCGVLLPSARPRDVRTPHEEESEMRERSRDLEIRDRNRVQKTRDDERSAGATGGSRRSGTRKSSSRSNIQQGGRSQNRKKK